MAELKVFLSSTCYDFSLLRSQLRIFIKNMGYSPVMSDYADVLYDPRIHTHTSCVDEVKNCDVLVLIIGGRYGGNAVNEALSRIDFDALENESTDVKKIKKDGLSITQLEVLTAIENSIPVYTFIQNDVWHDHRLYQANKSNEQIDSFKFTSIYKQETAKYIFGFIDFVRHRTHNNSIFQFEKGQDIEEVLKRQWSSYFQRLLRKERESDDERKRYDALSKGFEELKTAFLTSIDDDNRRKIARGTLKYRKLFNFLKSFDGLNTEYIIASQDNWAKLLKKAGVIGIASSDRLQRALDELNVKENDFTIIKHYIRSRTFIKMKNGDIKFTLKDHHEINFSELEKDWESFILMENNNRKIVWEVLADNLEPIQWETANNTYIKKYPAVFHHDAPE